MLWIAIIVLVVVVILSKLTMIWERKEDRREPEEWRWDGWK